MAIIDEQSLGLQVRVLCGDSPCPEYADTDQDDHLDNFGPTTPVCRRYVESREGVEFAIESSILPEGRASDWVKTKRNALSFHLSLDGNDPSSDAMISSPKRICTHRGVINWRDNTMRKFRFAAISTVESADEARLAEDSRKAKHLGLMKVVVLRAVEPDRVISKKYIPNADFMGSNNFSFTEKSLKGLAVSHGATTSRIPVRIGMNLVSVDYVDTVKNPFAVFYLKYRSRDDLQKMAIIPRPRTPTPSPEEGDDGGFADLSREEIERLARERFDEQRGRKRSRSVTVKAEDRKAVQLPPPRRAYKYTRTDDGKKAIDLTEDDG